MNIEYVDKANTDNEFKESEFEEMQKYCKVRFQKLRFIQNYTFISYDLFQKIQTLAKETSVQVVMDCVVGVTSENQSIVIYVEQECADCKKKFYSSFTKTRFMDLVKGKEKNLLCAVCKEKEKQEKKKQDKIQDEQRKQRVKDYTQSFIVNYLDPANSWNKEVSIAEKYSELTRKIFYADKEKVAEHIRQMPYRDFLETPYWVAVSQKKRQQAKYACEMCGSKGVLNVHHKHYQNHGNEIYNLKDLIVLCENCHKKFHDKLKD